MTLNITHLVKKDQQKKALLDRVNKLHAKEEKGLREGTLVKVDVTGKYNGVKTFKIMNKEKAIKLGLYKDEEAES
jgi:hypothetical protein